MKAIVIDSKYKGIPYKPENAKCIEITFKNDFEEHDRYMLLDNVTWQKQIELHNYILSCLIENNNELYFIKSVNKSGSFDLIEKYKGLWWEGEKNKKRFLNQSKELIIKNNENYIMAGYVKIEPNELFLKFQNSTTDILCFSNDKTITNLFSIEKTNLFNKSDIINYLLKTNAIILYFCNECEGTSLFLYGNNIEKLKQEISIIINFMQNSEG